jgi:hypothetical protein
MFASESTYKIFQQHMKETDPLLIRVQRDSADEYILLYNSTKKMWITTFIIIIIVIILVALLV